MAAIRELRRLFEAISKKDWESAQSVAEMLAASQAKRGNRSAARILRDSLHQHKNGLAPNYASVLELGLTKRNGSARLRDVVLPKQLRSELQAIIDEFRHSQELKANGLTVRKKLIFTGPPGCGKSLAAQALANELEFPHFVVRFDAVIGSYLGQTATHLRQLFRFAERTPSVLLFDEIDALGKRRGNPSDVGELDRIVIALMQELELTHPLGLIVATSNVPEHLDRALWRRYDAQFMFPVPSRDQLKSFVLGRAKAFGRKLPGAILSLAVSKPSFAEAETVVSNYLRQQIVSELNGRNGSRH
jgi:SpoVK/Ycf46/Vps4 family AAA+-type ATPase